MFQSRTYKRLNTNNGLGRLKVSGIQLFNNVPFSDDKVIVCISSLSGLNNKHFQTIIIIRRYNYIENNNFALRFQFYEYACLNTGKIKNTKRLLKCFLYLGKFVKVVNMRKMF